MGVHSKPLPFCSHGTVNLVKSTDKKGVYAEPVISSTYSPTKEVLNQRKQQKEDRLPFGYRFFKFFRSQDDFFGFSILMLIIFVCIEFISMDHLTIWLTDLCGVGNGKIVAMLIIVAVDFIFVVLQAMAFISYSEFKNKYVHEDRGGNNNGGTW